MKTITLMQSAQQFAPGLRELAAEMDFTLAAGGVEVEAQPLAGTGETGVQFDGSRAVITYGEPVHFFRLFAILLEKLEGGAFRHTQKMWFTKSGVMLDVSRNAVLTPEALRFFMRRMGVMGLNLAMLYTEDTYEVEGCPYFGYLRGRYTAADLKALDDYAALFGIEVVPCIQTLGHLEKYLRWAAAAQLADTPNVLLCGDEQVLAFIEQMITAASAPFRSKRIHLGMDEAWGIGSGRYQQKNGYRPAIEILRSHMAQVTAICRRHGLQPMIWSDMCLRPLSENDEYYDFSDTVRPVTKELADAVPKDLTLIYWDYYHHKKQEYLTMIERHRQYGSPLIFAGGSWNWSGPIPDYGKTFDSSEKALDACREQGVQEVFCTCWGDDGAESNLLNVLLGMQYYAENTYGKATLAQVFEAFSRCCGGRAEDFYSLRLFDELPGVPKDNLMVATPAKQILYQDVLMGLFDKHLRVQRDTFGSLKQWYTLRGQEMAAACRTSPRYAVLFAMYQALADVLADKAELGLELHDAYAAKDAEKLRSCVQIMNGLLPKLDTLTLRWEALWMSTNKPFGFDVISSRLGAVRGRTAYAAHRVQDYLDKKVPSLPEVEAEQLFFDGRATPLVEGTPLLCACQWHLIITASPI